MEIINIPVEHPRWPETIKVIDRTYLNVKSLKIADVQIYLDDIFLLDYDTGLFRLDILESQRI
jgi:hypothetical protein